MARSSKPINQARFNGFPWAGEAWQPYRKLLRLFRHLARNLDQYVFFKRDQKRPLFKGHAYALMTQHALEEAVRAVLDTMKEIQRRLPRRASGRPPKVPFGQQPELCYGVDELRKKGRTTEEAFDELAGKRWGTIETIRKIYWPGKRAGLEKLYRKPQKGRGTARLRDEVIEAHIRYGSKIPGFGKAPSKPTVKPLSRTKDAAEVEELKRLWDLASDDQPAKPAGRAPAG